jgi:hypothetical protein
MNMETKSKTRKLTELRAKTDRQLIELIDNYLDRGFHAEAAALLPLLRGPDRSRLEEKLHCAMELLGRKSVYAA